MIQTNTCPSLASANRLALLAKLEQQMIAAPQSVRDAVETAYGAELEHFWMSTPTSRRGAAVKLKDVIETFSDQLSVSSEEKEHPAVRALKTVITDLEARVPLSATTRERLREARNGLAEALGEDCTPTIAVGRVYLYLIPGSDSPPGVGPTVATEQERSGAH